MNTSELHFMMQHTPSPIFLKSLFSRLPFYHRTSEQCPHVVSLLSESFNPHVRCGAAMALGIACAGTGNKVCFV